MAAAAIPTTKPTVLAFEFTDTVRSEDLDALAATVERAFDRHDSVSLLLIFREWDGVEVSGTLDPDVVRTQFRSLTNVDRYAVVGAPSAARAMIELTDPLIPVDAETFDRDEEDAAWAFVEARPAV
jgi:hypothetical protein